MTPRPTAEHLPVDLLALVGKIAIQSAYIDLLLGLILGKFKGISEEQMAADIHPLDTRCKTKQIIDILNADGKHLSIKGAVTKARDLLNDRNLSIHAIIGYRDTKVENPVYIAFRGPYVGKDIPFSKQTLEPILTGLDQVSCELWEACSTLGVSISPA